MLRQFRSIGQEDAARLVTACIEEAHALGVAVSVAVADSAGHLLHFVRMDGAPLLSASIAQDKAYSVAAFNGLPTEAWWGLIGEDEALSRGIVKTDRLIVFGGGRPCLAGDELVGAVGVSGGSADQDIAVARAGAQAL
jgi:uncharacterized protein GlcG (DUF336 family)